MLQAMKEVSNRTLTENGAVARATTGTALLDFFSVGGALRNMDSAKRMNLFQRAYIEDKNMALKAMFYFRDVRGGQGQRQAFREQLNFLANNYHNDVKHLLKHVATYGRWDDLYSVVGTMLEQDALIVMEEQLQEDIANFNNRSKEGISLLAKWLKSENTSSDESKRLAKVTRKHFDVSSKTYRKLLSMLRKHIGIVETQMSSNEWGAIDFARVPSNAMMKHRQAFYKHQETRFTQYVEDVKSGKKKINSKTLYPYEIVGKLIDYNRNAINPDLADVMWKGLPNYIDPDKEENAIAVVDVSGSMQGNPMAVSISLGIYLAERCKGAYAGHFITFSESPTIQKVIGETIADKVNYLKQSKWGYNTNIESVLDLVLKTAVSKNIPKEEMIDRLYIISDMEFDKACGRDNEQHGYGTTYHAVPVTLMNALKAKFQAHGYEMPEIVFWNVNARNDQFPMSMDDRGFLNVSGLSPSIFKSVVGNKFVSPEELMFEVIDSERYEPIYKG